MMSQCTRNDDVMQSHDLQFTHKMMMTSVCQHLLQSLQYSILFFFGISMRLDRVFLIRNIVCLAFGLCAQHSFINLETDSITWKITKNLIQNHNTYRALICKTFYDCFTNPYHVMLLISKLTFNLPVLKKSKTPCI